MDRKQEVVIMKKLLLIDGNSVLFRAYHATAYSMPMSTSTGIPTNAVFGFISMLYKVLGQIKPDLMLVAWDAGKKTFRHDRMEQYKGTRKPVDEALVVQMPIAREFLDEAGYTQYEQEGYEADDIIGTVSAESPDMMTYILTGDKDMLQLIDSSTKVLLMRHGIEKMDVMDEQALKELWDLTPKQVIDLKGLMGDTSDNIPGVAHIGEKTALLLLHKYGSIDGVYDHIDEIKGKRKQYLEEGKEMAYLSREIATIFRQMELPFALGNLTLPDRSKEGSTDFYLKYEMMSLLDRLPGYEREENEKAHIVEDEEFYNPDEEDLFLLPLADFAAFKTQKLLGFLYPVKGEVHYLSAERARNDEGFRHRLASRQPVLTWDAKELLHLLDQENLPHPQISFDLHLAAFLLYSQATSQAALLEALGIHLPVSLSDLSKKSLGGFTRERALPVFADWCLNAARKCDQIRENLKDEDLDDLYWKVEFPLAFILYDMECQGIGISAEILKQIGEEFLAQMNDLAAEIYEMAGHPFNIGSPKQLGTVLFDELKLPGAGKKRSTAADVLEKLKDAHPIVEKVQDYRKLSKIVSTYVEGLGRYIMDGRIYTTFNQTMTQTGRLSSSDPNLQNISIKSEEGKRIRKAFVADKGCWLLSADYSQVELRMLAHMADEQMMIQAFQEDIDIHNRTASIIYGVPESEVTPDMRRTAKTVNFAIIYGQTEFGLSQELGITRQESRDFIQAYFASYPNIHRYMDSLISYCEEHGYVRTLLNRRRYIPEIQDKNFMTREFGKRAAMNAPIQGSAADLIKLAMIAMDKAIKEKGLKSRMLLQIHDELIFSVPDDELELMTSLVPEVMDSAMKLKVPLKASVSSGHSWYEAK